MPRGRLRLGGLVSERVVRARLDAVLERAPEGTGIRRLIPKGLFTSADPLTALEQTERAVAELHPEFFPSPWAILELIDRSPALQLLILQSIAGRQGRWAVRDVEVKDAKIGRDLLRGLGPIDPLGSAAKLEAAKTAYFAGSYLEASRLLVDADRSERTVEGSVQLAVALWRAGSIEAAVWAIRVALLEELDRFDLKTLLHAHRIESSLRLLHEQHGGFGAGELGRMALLAEDLARPVPRDRLPSATGLRDRRPSSAGPLGRSPSSAGPLIRRRSSITPRRGL
jgi:hypothetical protein